MRRYSRKASTDLVFACEVAKAACRPDSVVLVCDDDPSFVSTVVKLLEGSGHPCLCANTLNAALAYLRESPGRIGAVVADYWLPDGTGVELVDEALKYPSIAVFLVTADEDKAEDIKRERIDVAALSKSELPRIMSYIGA